MDQLYSYPDDLMTSIRKQKLWCNDAKYFKKVKISPSATIKMLSHGQQGVEKGISKSGKPIEVMGLLLGRPDNIDVNAFVISDALPLPIEGFETRVVADDENVINYMIELGESMELTRKEKFCGWYHTHPFDLDGTSHCFLSNTDITTQLQWQRMEDPHGNPWLAIVIDPLYSLAKGKPEMMAFRVYPPEYNPPANETPDGKIMKDDRLRVEKWGACWNRYYNLPIEYFMSNLATDALNKLSNKFLWEKPLTNASSSSFSSTSSNAVTTGSGGGVSGGNELMEEEIQKINSISNRMGRLKFRRNPGSSRGIGGGVGGYEDDIPAGSALADIGGGVSSGGGGMDASDKNDSKGLKQATTTGNEIANNHICQICTQLVKKMVFCTSKLHSIPMLENGGSGVQKMETEPTV